MSTSPCYVVVLNYNGRELLKDCLNSLVKQTYEDVRVSVVDNGSSDGSKEMVEGCFPTIRFLALPENRGFSVANNFALRDAVSRGAEYILLLNNDTITSPEFIAELFRELHADPKSAAVCPKILFASHPDRLWYAGGDFSLWTARMSQRGWKERDEGQFDGKSETTIATGCAVLLRTSALRETGLLDETLWAYLEDVEWSVRFIEKGFHIRFASAARIWHHDGATWVRSLGAGSQAKRQYYSTRNLLLIGWQHCRWFQIPTYLLGFMANELLFYSALRLMRRDFRALLAIYRGAGAALKCILLNRDQLQRTYALGDCQ
ncbi:MAG TPA: glycosyltransferase family 2 protein [Candidatus Sulfotelmatobacter sp.]|nr:glycosyltransferase family 2 protein [Candidatus Sulfotelmatobacter sp.]